jgi:hypothetical protein
VGQKDCLHKVIYAPSDSAGLLRKHTCGDGKMLSFTKSRKRGLREPFVSKFRWAGFWSSNLGVPCR